MTFHFEIFYKPKIQQGSLKLPAGREMLTLVTALDLLLCGDLHCTADILLGRFKTLEEATTSGSWKVAAEFEAVPKTQQGLTSDAERQRAANIQIRRVKLQPPLAALQRQAPGQ